MAIKHYIFILFIGLTFWAQSQQNSTTINANEIKSERSMYAKVYLKPNGDHEAVISPEPIHYKTNGNWEEINTTIKFEKGNYVNATNAIQSCFPSVINNSQKIKFTINPSEEVLVHAEKKLVLYSDQTGLNVQNTNAFNSIAVVSANSIVYPSIFKEINDEYTILKGQIKNNIILNSVPDVIKNISSGYFGIQETIELPAGWTIKASDNSVNQLTFSSILISDANGNNVLEIPEPVFFDKNGLGSDGFNPVEGKYLLSKENDVWKITTLVPVSWLKASNTQYPLSIDPTVVIVGTTGGWQSPNNFVDNPSFVFIGVCCSNLTHRAWIKFNISAIPTTSCITNVEIQPNVTTVANTIAEGVLINDVTGAFGPYGAINAAAYNDFGNGNYTSFTITTTGLYGYYSLGATANTLLQSQIPGGWFQVAFQFVNEPSTNYKIITATSSNLRVTYTNPPCAVLPIELLSFDANCINDKVNLTWRTATQENNNYFTIEKTINGNDYETVGVVKGAGNTSTPMDYSYVDSRPSNGTSYYTLKQTDFNGQTKILKTLVVNCDKTELFEIKPNPNAGLFVIVKGELGSKIVITDSFGNTVLESEITDNQTKIDLSKESNGIYFIHYSNGTNTVSKRFIINK